MPSVMTLQSDEERTRTATAFTHFLLSQKENHFAPGAPDVVAAHLTGQHLVSFQRMCRVPGHLDYTLYRSAVYERLASDNVKAEMAGRVNDFALASLKGVSRANFFL